MSSHPTQLSALNALINPHATHLGRDVHTIQYRNSASCINSTQHNMFDSYKQTSSAGSAPHCCSRACLAAAPAEVTCA
jgi:hypothetical protein